MKEEEKVKNTEHEAHKKKKNNHRKNNVVDTLKKQNELLNEKIIRLNAEMQNMRRHFEEDKTRLLKYEGEKIFLEFLPIVDNFERALMLDDDNLTDELSGFLSGFKMIYGNLKQILETFEIKEIKCIGESFNPDTMNAVLVDEIKDKDDNIVIDCMQKGYTYKDKVIRPAMVKVNHKESE